MQGVLRQRTAAVSERSTSDIEQFADALKRVNVASGSLQSVPHCRGRTLGLGHVSGAKYALVNKTPYAQKDVTIPGKPIRGDCEKPGNVAAFGE